MKLLNLFATAALATAAAIEPRATKYAGYLITTFSDANPAVQFHLSNGNNPLNYSFSNGGKAVLNSTVGTKAVRDVFLLPSPDRSKWWILATDLDVRADGFSWDQVTRHGSRGLVVWESKNLVDWSAPRLVTVENEQAGMAWAPSAVWDAATSQYYVFWASRIYDAADTQHTGAGSSDHIRWATTKDFRTFTAPQDYTSPAEGVIDQEFQYLGTPGHYARFFKNQSVNYVQQEISTNGLFGPWKRVPGYVSTEQQYEGPAAFEDNTKPGTFYVLCDNYSQYNPFVTTDILNGKWTKPTTGSGYPTGLKHGSVTPLTAAEYKAWAARYPA